MNARKSFGRSKRGHKGARRYRNHWDEDNLAIRRKDHRRGRRTAKLALFASEGSDID